MWAWRYKYNNIIHNINGLIMNYYAVHAGRKPGIYNTWKECEAQVKHFSQAKYKKFSTLEEAQCFVNVGISSVNNKNKVCLTNCHCDTFDKQKNDGTLSLKRKAKSSDILSTKLLKLQGNIGIIVLLLLTNDYYVDQACALCNFCTGFTSQVLILNLGTRQIFFVVVGAI